MTETYILKNEEETAALGEKLAERLKPGDVVALRGDLGVGKTALTRAIAKGLGVSTRVASPTFTIVMEHEGGRLPLYHFDVYRVSDEDELFEAGFFEYLKKEGVCVIEWADLIEDLLPEDAIFIDLSYGEGENERICSVKW
ncbi:MAG: tRNA (adenosine(37)-N6)-threonylcarbamoyltransferase complex ATPase subunit type 1 TsaE [Firmicutes bacterium]|nr:tRNA (adenosine(37)-N6)-threonylcarbamoyltransferase complex ATPase subunit type 1 TsaE [Bacillota bacterium]